MEVSEGLRINHARDHEQDEYWSNPNTSREGSKCIHQDLVPTIQKKFYILDHERLRTHHETDERDHHSIEHGIQHPVLLSCPIAPLHHP